jgi:hypothetical protein
MININKVFGDLEAKELEYKEDLKKSGAPS